MCGNIFLGDDLFFLLNFLLAMGSGIMGLIFIVMPLPDKPGLKNYRISLRVLAAAYLVIAGLTTISLYYKLPEVRLLSPIELIISSTQAILFALSLITLFNPTFLSARIMIKHLLPVFIFSILFIIFSSFWGDPILQSPTEIINSLGHPVVILCFSFCLFYLIQLVYLSVLFFKEEKKYKIQLDDYFSDNYRLRLNWVRLCYYSALVIGISSFFSFFLYSLLVKNISSGIYALFYIGFGFFYIQYPQTYLKIEMAINNNAEITEEYKKSNKQLSWEKLKQQVIIGKYYLNPGINIEELAQILKISRTTLSGMINREEGINFNGWINRLRIDEAKEILRSNPEYSIASVAERVGFSEQSNFSRQFKLITNKSPSEWRLVNRA